MRWNPSCPQIDQESTGGSVKLRKVTAPPQSTFGWDTRPSSVSVVQKPLDAICARRFEAARTSRRDCQIPSTSHGQFISVWWALKGRKFVLLLPTRRCSTSPKFSAFDAHSTSQRLRRGKGALRCCLRLGLCRSLSGIHGGGNCLLKRQP